MGSTANTGLATIIYAHPWEGSFNYAILRQVKALLDARGQEYRLLDLHADGFNPVYS
ncbi:MAG: NAD(P)H-dependent oxidoreductase, partial [Lautropia sp.]|nr:NAD(P)H-dependent oxidoreductase [Lautropia sp.]